MRIHLAAISIIACVATLAGCASSTELQDQPVQLQPGYGIAAIVFRAQDRVTQLSFAAKYPGGKSFEVPDTAGGLSVFLLPVRAGRYCLKHFLHKHAIFESDGDLGCLTVIPGHISYGGELVPSDAMDGGAFTDQQYNPESFVAVLHQRYPVLAGLFPLAAPTPPPAGVDISPRTYQFSMWAQNVPDTNTQAIYVQNNTAWTLKLTYIDLSECENVKQACGKQPLGMTLAPFETKQAFVIGPADATQAYNYRYNFDYDQVD